MLRARFLHDRPLFRSAGLSIRGIGVNETMPASFCDRPNGTGDWLFMVFHDTVSLRPKRGEIRVEPGTMIFWSRGASHGYGDRSARWSHSWIHCDGPAVSAIVRNAKMKLDRPHVLRDPSIVLDCLLDLHEELSATAVKVDPVIVRNTFENLVREAARNATRERKPQASPGLSRAKLHIDSRYEQRIDLAQLAAIAELSPRHFCSEFARQYGAPPIAYLIQRRLHAAAALLRGSSVTVETAGRRVGYGDVFHFSKQFKAFFGVPPSQLRLSDAK